MTNKDDTRPVLIHYIFLLVSAVCVFVPHYFISGMALSFIVCLTIFAYAQRLDQEPESFICNHMSYMIRTFWRGLIALLFLLILSLSLLFLSLKVGFMDTRPLVPCMIDGELSPCMPDFIKTNPFWFFSASLIVFAPVILYFLFRYSRGLLLAKNNLRVL